MIFARASAVQLERRIDVGRALHVDPEEVAAPLGPLEDALEVALAQRAIEIEAELRRLDRDLRVEPGRRNLVEHVEVVLRDLLGFAGVVRFSPSCVRMVVMPSARQLARGAQRVLDPSPPA